MGDNLPPPLGFDKSIARTWPKTMPELKLKKESFWNGSEPQDQATATSRTTTKSLGAKKQINSADGGQRPSRLHPNFLCPTAPSHRAKLFSRSKRKLAHIPNRKSPNDL